MLNAGEDAEKLDPSSIADGNVKWYNHFGNSLGFLKIKLILEYSLTVVPLDIYP